MEIHENLENRENIEKIHENSDNSDEEKKGKTDKIWEINRRHRIINETVDLGLWNRFRWFQVFLGLFSKK